jgi:F-type H+-transporting ATPase subunit e
VLYDILFHENKHVGASGSRTRWHPGSGLFAHQVWLVLCSLGLAYGGTQHYSYLKHRAKERRVAGEDKKRLNEWKRIERELAEAQDDSNLKASAS